MNERNHWDFILRQLDDWISKNQAALSVPNTRFVENNDFKLMIKLHHLSDEARMTCSCGIRIQLGKERRNFSLSNFCKHIKSARCKMMRNKGADVLSKIVDEEDVLCPSIINHFKTSSWMMIWTEMGESSLFLTRVESESFLNGFESSPSRVKIFLPPFYLPLIIIKEVKISLLSCVTFLRFTYTKKELTYLFK
jgi:hypothetical protein